MLEAEEDASFFAIFSLDRARGDVCGFCREVGTRYSYGWNRFLRMATSFAYKNSRSDNSTGCSWVSVR